MKESQEKKNKNNNFQDEPWGIGDVNNFFLTKNN